ncbi:RagB/SusD family nutrient uptake outer membrane protein [Polaribacter vadi]|uniref:RagB/SusD family nutrient uptake outer membrane protein n=1 Tax=Polaribacter TaxID=52959 RepID=UPI001C0A1896|nr:MULTISPECIES: RagB/SusD family nutrient uptake outer membrane protein [Polaribacter]MBU3012226.1 RagB/SusD family nutrient uptake outer membrane protein [Polaribacter vadi]MDO6742042.1 RagB/SusD family nutrient uptake outer membrane protein [Polaribacter sp. 1_MG-2023]
MQQKFKYLIVIMLFSLGVISCHEDLNQSPIDPDSFTEEDVFSNATDAQGALAKLYASLALTGQQGPSGQADISDIDEGFSQYSRMLFNLNELTTDHAVVGWGDAGLPDLHGQYWSGSNDFTEAMYYRLAQEVSFCNSFIDNAAILTDTEVAAYIAEARFLRAFAYYNLMDLYGSVPLVTKVTTELPEQATRIELFNFIESELLEITDQLKPSGANEYGRVDQVAAWALLSKLYLNAEIFTGTPRYAEAVTFSNNVMSSSYSINTNDANGNGTAYDELFLADNDVNGAQNEFIFTLNFDGLRSQTYGGSTFLVHAAIGGSMNATEFGVNGGWGGLRTTKSLVNKFDVDVTTLNPNLGPVASWGIIGDSTPNGWNDPDTKMYETGTDTYAIYANLTPGELKFRMNNDWGINYGDDNTDGSLEAGGSNIPVSTAGTYYITLDLNTLTYAIEPFVGDSRGMFYKDGQTLEIDEIPTFENGYAVTKFKNLDSNGNQGSDAAGDFVDTDLPLIRLAEIYLNYAEAALRGGGGDLGLAVTKINELRERAFGNSSGNITSGDLTLDFVLNERSRELYWEGQRRTDLVRYNYFTTDAYLWPFKGDSKDGTSVEDYRNIFPLPNNIITTNPNLTQNTGY